MDSNSRDCTEVMLPARHGPVSIANPMNACKVLAVEPKETLQRSTSAITEGVGTVE